MKASDFPPPIVELMAKNIILSKGGTIHFNDDSRPEINFRPGPGEEVIGKVPVIRIYYTGVALGPEGIPYLCSTPNCRCFCLEPDDLPVMWSFIVEHYPSSDKDLFSGEELKKRLDLREYNLSFISEHGDLNEDDFAFIDCIQHKFAVLHQADEDGCIPKPGDTVEGTYYDGACKFSRGVVESFRTNENRLSVCTSPYGEPWVHKKDDAIVVTTSGGPYFGYAKQDFQYKGKEKRLFREFGHAGVCANGTISFPVEVNCWKVVEPEK